MANQAELDYAYLDMANRWGQLSTSKRKKVGCLLVKNNQIISDGFNGTPPGFYTNDCEDKNGKTKREVLHAEKNCILKLAKNGVSGEGSILYCSLSPCIDCAIMIAYCNIKRIVYLEQHRLEECGLNYLLRNKIVCDQIQ